MESMLASAEQYSETSVVKLEAYVRRQASGAAYDFVANMALVKLYQFYPAKCDGEVLALVFGLALAARPATDLKALSYACPESLLEANVVAKKFSDCDALLDESQFAEFWQTLEKEKLEALVPSLAPAMRRFLGGLLAATFQSVSLDFFAKVLGYSSADARDALQTKSKDFPYVASSDASLVTFLPNAENQPRQQTLDKSVGLPTLLSLFDDDADIFTTRKHNPQSAE